MCVCGHVYACICVKNALVSSLAVSSEISTPHHQIVQDGDCVALCASKHRTPHCTKRCALAIRTFFPTLPRVKTDSAFTLCQTANANDNTNAKCMCTIDTSSRTSCPAARNQCQVSREELTQQNHSGVYCLWTRGGDGGWCLRIKCAAACVVLEIETSDRAQAPHKRPQQQRRRLHNKTQQQHVLFYMYAPIQTRTHVSDTHTQRESPLLPPKRAQKKNKRMCGLCASAHGDDDDDVRGVEAVRH